jgi:hypothetical protein
MKLKNVFLIVFVLFAKNSFSQNSVSKIETKSGVHYITTSIDYPITGTYLFDGAEPIVELTANGTGFYQLHEQPKRAINWGIECLETGEPKFIKGYNSAEYSLWYQFTTAYESDTNLDWNFVEFSIHFNTLKMYIQGERVKSYVENEK